MHVQTKLPKVGTTIFTVMSQLAAQHQAVNLGQGFPDFEVPVFLREALSRAMLAGADGVISVASNVLPGAFRRLCDLARAGQASEATAWDARMVAIYDFLGCEPNPIPVKALLARQGLGHGLRLPLLPLSAAYQSSVPAIAEAIDALEKACGAAAAA